MPKKKKYTFIDLFAGIGGFHQAMHSVGAKCVFASEWDKYARQTYEANYKEIAPNLFENNCKNFNCDINDAKPEEIPDFDVCCGGFPCQAFSIAGLKRGFEDTRGTLFFNIANIVKYKKEHGHAPKVLQLEQSPIPNPEIFCDICLRLLGSIFSPVCYQINALFSRALKKVLLTKGSQINTNEGCSRFFDILHFFLFSGR